jgi:hypothetical protein
MCFMDDRNTLQDLFFLSLDPLYAQMVHLCTHQTSAVRYYHSEQNLSASLFSDPLFLITHITNYSAKAVTVTTGSATSTRLPKCHLAFDNILHTTYPTYIYIYIYIYMIFLSLFSSTNSFGWCSLLFSLS